MDDTIRAVTPAEAAERLHLHLRTVQRLIADGSLRAVRIGRVWRVPLKALDEFLSGADNRQGATPVRVLSEEERLARIDAVCGKYRDALSPVDEFLARKREEVDLEEESFRRRYPEAA